MNPTQSQLNQPSTRSTQPMPPVVATCRPVSPTALTHQVDSINPLWTLRDPTKVHTQPYLYLNRSFPIHTPGYSNRPSPASTPSDATATPTPILSVRPPSTRHPSPQPPSMRPSSSQPSSMRPSSSQPSSTPIYHNNPRSILSKRSRSYTPGQLPLLTTSLMPSASLPHLPISSPRPLPVRPASGRPAKRPRLDSGSSSTATKRGGSQPPVFLSSVRPSQSPGVVATAPKPNPKPKKVPLHPLAVDYSRPISRVVPQPPFCLLNFRRNPIPIYQYPKNPYPERSLEDELRGAVDPAKYKELVGLARKQQQRASGRAGVFPDPNLDPVPISSLDARSSSHTRSEMTSLCGPPLRNNESVHLGERLTNPKVIVVDDDDDDDDGFEVILDLYRAAVQGSTLSMELELLVGRDIGLPGAGWKDSSTLEVSIKYKPSTPRSSGETQGSRIRALAEYEQIIKAERGVSRSESTTHNIKEPPTGIGWFYSSCGYAAGEVVNPQKAKTRW